MVQCSVVRCGAVVQCGVCAVQCGAVVSVGVCVCVSECTVSPDWNLCFSRVNSLYIVLQGCYGDSQLREAPSRA